MEEETKVDHTNLLDLPNEVLLQIVRHLNAAHLPNISRTCTRLESISKEIFAEKFNGKTESQYFDIDIRCYDDPKNQKIYRPFFERFGQKMTALIIRFYGPRQAFIRNETDFWLFKLIKTHCSFLTHLIIYAGKQALDPMLIFDLAPGLISLKLSNMRYKNDHWASYHLAQLTHLCLEGKIDLNAVHRFVCQNPQLKHFSLVGSSVGLTIKILNDQLNSFKSLEFINNICDVPVFNIKENIDQTADSTTDELEMLTISVDTALATSVLRALPNECKSIKRLNLFLRNCKNVSGSTVDAICSFDKLTSLHLCGFSSKTQISNLIQRSLKLLTFQLTNTKLQFSPDDVLNVFKECPQLTGFLLENKEHNSQIEPHFTADFHHKLVDIAQNRNIKFKYIGSVIESVHEVNTFEIVITEEKIIVNGELRYWTGYEADQSRSQMRFVDLNEKCIDKIVEYLSKENERALYRTCSTMKRALAKHIERQVFNVSMHDIFEAKRLLYRFQAHLRKLSVDMKVHEDIPDYENVLELWNIINRFCNSKLIEIHLGPTGGPAIDIISSLNLSFPNLEKLQLESVFTSGPHLFPSIDCPKLKHLELGHCEVNGQIDSFGITMENLEVLKFFCLHNDIINLLCQLSDNVCLQLKEFTVRTERISDQAEKQMICTVARFRNLTTLNYLVPYFEIANTKHVFENCTKLKKFSFIGGSYAAYVQEMLQHIKHNCKQLEEIQLVKTWHYSLNVYENWTKYYSKDYRRDVIAYIEHLFPNIRVNGIIVHYDGREGILNEF